MGKKARNSTGFQIVTYLIGLIAFIFASTWFSWSAPSNIVRWVFSIVVLSAIFYCDNSGIRMSVAYRLPAAFPYRNKLRISRKNVVDVPTELFKTFVYLDALLYWLIPELRVLLAAIAIALPVLSVYRYLRHSDVIKFRDPNKNNISPTASTLLASALIFALSNLLNSELNSFFWYLWVSIAAAPIIAFLLLSKEFRIKKTVLIDFSLIMLAFSFGTLCSVNQDFDFSEPSYHFVTVVDKYTSGGRQTTLYVTVSPFGDRDEDVSIAVGIDAYRQAYIGEKARVAEYQGVLHSPWYYLVL
jgi:hypothetical protein